MTNLKSKKIFGSFAAISITLVLSMLAFTGCANQEATPEVAQNTARNVAAELTAEGWNAETDTPAILHIVSADVAEDEEPAMDIYEVIEPNATDATIELTDNNYTVEVVYPMTPDGQAYALEADANPFELAVADGDNAIVVTLEKRTLSKDELQHMIDVMNGSDVPDNIKAAVVEVYTKYLNAEEPAVEAEIVAEGTAAGNAATSNSASAPAENNASAKPSGYYEQRPIYGTESEVIVTYSCGWSTSHYSPSIARSNWANHKQAAEANSNTIHTLSGQSTSSHQVITGYEQVWVAD